MLSEDHNLEMKGQGQLDLKNLQVRLDNVRMNLDFSTIAINELEKAIPSLKPSDLGLTLKGQMETVICICSLENSFLTFLLP